MDAQQPAQVTVQSGQRFTVAIQDLAFGGEGVARIGEFVIFVPFVVPGETVEIEVTEVKRSFARGKLLQVIVPSPHRVKPECAYFGECGGCQYQHIAYPLQLEWKRKQVADLLERVGRLSGGLVAPVIPCPRPYGYRNRIMLRSQWNRPLQKLVIGYLRHDSRLVVDIEECKIAEPALNEQIKLARSKPPPKGGLKLTLRIPPPDWTLPPDAFFQNNFFLLPELVRVVRECLQESGASRLIDAYCGVGFFAIELAGLVQEFIGVEVDRMAIRAARQNAARRNVQNGEFIAARAEELLPDILMRFPPEQTALILDPPRTGCPAESLQKLRQARPRQIIYISCHPAMLARDLNILCADGVFEVCRVQPLDMFPQTQHLECVADLRLRAPSGPA